MKTWRSGVHFDTRLQNRAREVTRQPLCGFGLEEQMEILRFTVGTEIDLTLLDGCDL
jgi:hypothetical protein